MLKIEKKIFDWVDKNKLVLSVLAVTVLTLYLRKIGVWWNYSYVAASFDMHQNYTESSLYYVMVRLVQELPLLPLHSIKWLAGLCDYVLVYLCIRCFGERLTRWKEKEVIWYIILIFSPVLYIRGIIWGQIDSVAMVFLVLALLLWEKKRVVPAIISAIIACGLYPCLLPIAIVYLYYVEKEISLSYLLWLIVGTVVLLGGASLILGGSFPGGVETLLRWCTYNVLDGSLFVSGADWLMQLVILYGLPVTTILLLGTLRGKISYKWTVLAHVIVTVLYGSRIFLEKLY